MAARWHANCSMPASITIPKKSWNCLGRGWDWLAKLHGATRRELPDDFAPNRRELLRTETALICKPADILTASQARRIREGVTELLCLPLPYSRCHGDFNPNNALRPFDEPAGFYGFDFEFARNAVCLYRCVRVGAFRLAVSAGNARTHGRGNLSAPVTVVVSVASARSTVSQHSARLCVGDGRQQQRPASAVCGKSLGFKDSPLAAKLRSPLGDQSPDLPTWQNALRCELERLD